MNETTDKLIHDLSEKLGTTAEHLWSVLVHQAPISAIIDTCESLILAVICVYSGRLLIRWKKTLQETNDTDHPGFVMLCTLLTALSLFTVFWGLCNITEIVIAFTNPEYWALKQIVK